MNEVLTLTVFQNWIDHEDRMSQFRAALPSHVTPDRFVRIIKTAVAKSPELLTADKTSLMLSCMDAAADGLLPNGKEAALVIYKTKTRDGRFVDKVQYMPMIRGLYKLARNSKEIAVLAAHVVYEKDDFFFSYGFETELKHAPYLGEDRGRPVAVYACATTKDGERDVEVMSVGDVNKIRDCSKTFKKNGTGPWKDFWDEMARKTVMRRLLKRLPMSEEVERAIDRDNAFYEMEQRRLSSPEVVESPSYIGSARERLAGLADEAFDAETGEIIEVDTAGESLWKIPVHPTEDGNGTDWVRWEKDILQALNKPKSVDDAASLYTQNADALDQLAKAYPTMGDRVRKAIKDRQVELGSA